MSSPITINYAYERSELSSSSPSSPGVYVPIHKRTHISDSTSGGLLGTSSSYTSSSRSRSVSPAPSSMRSISPAPHSSQIPIYTPADLILLSTSPLSKLSPQTRDTLRTIAPEVLQSRKQRKAQEWRARHPQSQTRSSHRRTSSRTSSSTHSSEEEEEKAASWRRV